MASRVRFTTLAATLLVVTSLAQGCAFVDWLFGIETDPVGISVVLTNNSGEATVTTSWAKILVEAVDQDGASMENVEVHSYELEDSILVIAGREDAFPSIHIVSRYDFSPVGRRSEQSRLVPQLPVITLLVVLVKVISAAITIWDYINNPGEFPFQIPGVIEGSRKVKKACSQIDMKDVLSLGVIGELIKVGRWTFKALQVMGAPARIRGTTAINLGFTRKTLLKESAEAIGKELAKFLELLDVDIITNCEYIYEDRNGKTKSIPVLQWTVERPSSRPKIISIEFPQEIPADGSKRSGTIYFKDRDGDVIWVQFYALVGNAGSEGFAPPVYGQKEGAFGFDLRCNQPQTITYRVTLKDKAGNRSDPFDFTFTCTQAFTEEICGNGIDDDGDGYIDEGCFTITMLLDDTGPEKDDVFRLSIDGVSRGDTPKGSKRYYELDNLTLGFHTVEVFVVHDISPPGTFTLTLYGGAIFEDGSTQYDCEKYDTCPGQGGSRTFTIIVP